MSAPLSLRLAWREMRGGLRGFRVFLACLAIGVASITAVGSVTQGVLASLAERGQAILGADVELRLTHRTASEEELSYLTNASEKLSPVMRLRSMARAISNDNRTLVEVKAVDDFYPLYGDLRLSGNMALPNALAKTGGEWGIAVDPTLTSRLKVDVGDKLRIGDLDVTIRAFITQEPDKSNEGFLLGPTILIHNDAMAETGLVRLGSLIRYHYRLALEPDVDLDVWQDRLAKAFPDAGWQIRDRSNGAPGVRRFVNQMEMFLTLVGLTALTVGGVGVGNAVRGYLDRKTASIATLKTLGAEGALVFRVYLIQISLMAAIAIALGLIIGSLAPLGVVGALESRLPVTPELGLYPKAVLSAAAYGFLITLIFAVWPLAKAREVPAARLFRALVAPEGRWPRKRYIALVLLAVFLLVALAMLMVESASLAAGFIGAALFALGFLRATGWAIERLAARLPRLRHPGLRIAIANLHRPGAATAAVVLSLGLGLTLFAGISAIEANMSRQVSETLPSEAPAFFFVDIQREEADAFRNTLSAVPGAENVEMVPSLRGPITKVNGVPASEVEASPDAAWVLRGDRGLTYAADLPEGNQITAGEWWDADYRGPPLISMGDEIARGLGLDVGDTLSISVLGREITATIASLRQIDWGSYGFNFVIIFAPGTLEGAPHTYMATIEADGAAEETAYRTITDAFPAVTAIRMKEVLSSLNDLLGQIGAAVRLTALVTIIAGIFVLAGAMAAGYQARAYDSVVLKVLGATKMNVLRAYLLEYLLLGTITGVIALGLGTLAAYIVVTQVFETDWLWPPFPMAVTLSAAIALTVILGLITTWRVLSLKPYRLLSTV